MIITDTRHLLAARSVLGPLPLPGARLTASQEMLLAAIAIRAQLDGEYEHLDHEYARKWAMVETYARHDADALLMFGYLEKHPNQRTKRWYRITAAGLSRAQFTLDDKADEFDIGPTVDPDAPTDERRQQGRNRAAWEQKRAFERLARDLAAGGWFYVPEPARVPTGHEVVFYNPFNGEYRMFRWRTSLQRITEDWEERNYYRPVYDADGIAVEMPSLDEVLDTLPF